MMDRRALLAGLAALASAPLRAEWQEPAAPLTAPPLPAFSLSDRAGQTLASPALLAPVTLVHFWASWCVSCREEFPALQALQADMAGEGLRVLAISVDRLGWPVIDRTVETLGVRGLALYHDINREAARALGIEALPTTIVVDQAGRERARHRGTVDWGQADVRMRLRRLAG